MVFPNEVRGNLLSALTAHFLTCCRLHNGLYHVFWFQSGRLNLMLLPECSSPLLQRRLVERRTSQRRLKLRKTFLWIDKEVSAESDVIDDRLLHPHSGPHEATGRFISGLVDMQTLLNLHPLFA